MQYFQNKEYQAWNQKQVYDLKISPYTGSVRTHVSIEIGANLMLFKSITKALRLMPNALKLKTFEF